jgi:hypothetical protein
MSTAEKLKPSPIADLGQKWPSFWETSDNLIQGNHLEIKLMVFGKLVYTNLERFRAGFRWGTRGATAHHLSAIMFPVLFMDSAGDLPQRARRLSNNFAYPK